MIRCISVSVAASVATIACENRLAEPPTEAPALSIAASFTGWSALESIETAWPGAHIMFNTVDLEGCPNISADGKTMFLASTRPGGEGGIDIWYSTRARTEDPWGEPVNAGQPVNSGSNDFCPTLTRDGHTFFFVSNRPNGCGGGDIYMTRMRPDGWDDPVNLGCQINSSVEEASPFLVEEPGTGPVLYFSSNRPGGFAPEAPGVPTGDSDIYRSVWRGGTFDVPELVDGVNTASEDGHPNVRHDALEIFFFSTRPGTLGMADIYAATRSSTKDAWSTPLNLGAAINSPLAETRPSLSWDGTSLYVGSTRAGGEGSSDFYVARRTKQ